VLIAVNGEASTGREANEPAATISANHGAAKYRAVLVVSAYGGAFAGAEGREPDRPPTMCLAQEPSVTVNGQSGGRQPWRAVLLEGSNAGQSSTYATRPRPDDEPAHTITASKVATRAVVGSRVVSLTPRALARLQSVPDSYRLPANRRLACRIIGDGVPSLLAQRIVEANR
jgi:site-specific DNA-cytosine methylase